MNGNPILFVCETVDYHVRTSIIKFVDREIVSIEKNDLRRPNIILHVRDAQVGLPLTLLVLCCNVEGAEGNCGGG